MHTTTFIRVIGLVIVFFLHPSVFASIATYRFTETNNWTPQQFTVNYPAAGHFSNIGLGTHDDTQLFWELNQLASPGTELMAEAGNMSVLFNGDFALMTPVFQRLPAPSALASCES